MTYEYAFYNDTFQIEPLVALFEPDGVLDFTPAGMRRHEGHASIRDYFVEWMEKDGHPFLPFWENVRSWWVMRAVRSAAVSTMFFDS